MTCWKWNETFRTVLFVTETKWNWKEVNGSSHSCDFPSVSWPLALLQRIWARGRENRIMVHRWFSRRIHLWAAFKASSSDKTTVRRNISSRSDKHCRNTKSLNNDLLLRCYMLQNLKAGQAQIQTCCFHSIITSLNTSLLQCVFHSNTNWYWSPVFSSFSPS